MTRSKLLHTAPRHYMEKQSTLEAVAMYKKERAKGKLKVLEGSMTNLMK